ncbi:MAG: right-handed parallel beta-helix repeat-containing protein, partial [Methanolobus sp.]
MPVRGNIKIHGFEIDANYANNAVGTGAKYYRIMYFSHIDDISVYDMYLHHNADDILRFDYCSNIKIYDNTGRYQGHEFAYLYKCSDADIYDNDIAMGVNSGIRCELTKNLKIHGNEIYHEGYSGGYTGIYIRSFAAEYPVTNVEIYDNVIHDTYYAGIYLLAFDYFGYNAGLTDESQASNVRIYNNIIYNTNIGNHVPGGGISTAGFSNTAIENNVIYNTKGNGINILYDYDDPGFDNVDYYIRNNIIMAGTSNGYAVRNYEGNTHDVTVEYNDIYKNSGTYTGSGITYRNNIAVDPMFYNEGSKDFHLKSTYGRWTGSSWATDSASSPCIDAGDPDSNYGNERENNGNKINIGAYGNTNEASLSGALTGGATLNEAPTASIDSVSSNEITEGTTVTFEGSGVDEDGEIVAYSWESSIDGSLSSEEAFSTATLSSGEHTIIFTVVDDTGATDKTTATITVSDASTEDDTPASDDTSANEDTPTEENETVNTPENS